MAKLFLFVVMLFLPSCDHEYTLTIQMRDSLGVKHPDISEVFTAVNDTLAFKQATTRFGLYRSLQRERNRLKRLNHAEPSDFTLAREDSSVIHFPPDVTEKLFGDEVRYWEAKLKEVDKTTPEYGGKKAELIRVER